LRRFCLDSCGGCGIYPTSSSFTGGPRLSLLFLAETLTDAFILTWVYNNSRGSLLPDVILHAAQDKSFGMLAVLMPNVPTDQLYVLYIVIDLVMLLAIVVYTRGTLSLISERALPRSSADGLQVHDVTAKSS
jgi:hypothetical protein